MITYLSCLCAFMCIFYAYLHYQYSKLHKDFLLMTKLNEALEEKIRLLETRPAPEKKVLSIEAQQILHDMTANGGALVRIVPMNPADMFWRSPL